MFAYKREENNISLPTGPQVNDWSKQNNRILQSECDKEVGMGCQIE